MTDIHEREGWPRFRLDQNRLAGRLAALRHRQGRLLGRMEGLGLALRAAATLEGLTEEILKSNEIEGEKLDKDQVRSSLARRLGVDIGTLTPADRNVEGVVDMMLDATQKFSEPLTKARLFRWHAALFPTGSAPAAARADGEMRAFLRWFNAAVGIDPVLKAGIAHVWFVTMHPFDDGNGRIARALTNLLLARSEQSAQRFYSMSAQIRKKRNDYYELLEATHKGDLDITSWIEWFLGRLGRAFEGAETELIAVLAKARFWERHQTASLNDRQRMMMNKLLDGFEGKLTSSKWAKTTKCSPDTALRDIQGLIARGILEKDAAGGRSTSYSLAEARTSAAVG